VSFVDVAKFAVAALDNPHAKNTVIQVGGPEALSPLEVVKIFEEKSEKAFIIEHVPLEGLQSQKENAPDPLQESFAALMVAYAYGNPMDMRQTLLTYPVQMMTVKEYARQVIVTA
jgi:NADH dehydrogenase